MTLTELNKETYCIRELNVSEVLALNDLDQSDPLSIVPLLSQLLSSPSGKPSFDIIVTNLDNLLELVEKMNTDVFGKEQKSSNKSEDILKARAMIAKADFINSVITLIEKGHPNLLTYPYSFYTKLVTKTNKETRK